MKVLDTIAKIVRVITVPAVTTGCAMTLLWLSETPIYSGVTDYVIAMLGLTAVRHGVTRVTGVSDVTQSEAPRQEHGFVLVWPAAGETRWDTARRLRVPQEALKPAGSGALLAFRK